MLAIGDRIGESFSESAYLRLLQILYSSAPDARLCTPRGLIAYYLPSSRAIAAVEQVISSHSRQLRDSDPALGEPWYRLGARASHR